MALAGILLFVVALLFVVMVHEAGHFLMAKAFRIKVEQFFVGFGPRIWSTRRGETEYGVKALPLGGYVRIAGMNPFEEVPPEDTPRTYGAKPPWQRALVILAGPVTHFLLAIVCLTIFFVAVGTPSRFHPVIGQVEPTLNGEPSPAARAGLRAGDEIVALDGRELTSTDEFIAYTRSHVGQEIEIRVLREGRGMTFRAAPVLAEVEGRRYGRLGVILGPDRIVARDRVDPCDGVGRAVVTTGAVTKALVLRLGDVFGPSGVRRIGELLLGEDRRTDDVTSVVGTARVAGQAADAGAYDVLFELFAVVNIFVGILNLLPLPPLDGGHLAVVLIEKISRRKIDPRRLIPVTAVVAGYLILFMISLVYLDIVKPLPNPFE